MSIKTDVQLKQNYLTRLKIKKGIGLIVCVCWCMIIAGCTYQQDIGTQTDEAEKELQWRWIVDVGEYEDIFIADEDIIAAKNKQGKWGMITLQQEEIVPFKYDNISGFSEKVSIAYENGEYSFINVEGEIICKNQFQEVMPFRESLAAVKENNLWGYISISGEKVIHCQYEEVKAFSDGLAAVKEDGMWGYINNEGEKVIDFQYHDAYSFSEGVAIVRIGELYGTIGKDGERITDFQFDTIRDFCEGYAAVEKNSKWGFINASGEICIPCQYDEVSNFSEGKAAVMRMNQEEQLEEWAYINKAGDIQIDFYPYESSEGRRILVGDFQNGIAFVSKTLYCIIDETGKDVFDGNSKFFISAPVYNKEYDVIPGYVYIDEEMLTKKYGLMGLNGEERIEPLFDYIFQIQGQYVIVSKKVDGIEQKGIIELSWK